MTKQEVALELTLKAIESNYLHADNKRYLEEEDINNANNYNANLIVDFYNHILDNIYG